MDADMRGKRRGQKGVSVGLMNSTKEKAQRSSGSRCAQKGQAWTAGFKLSEFRKSPGFRIEVFNIEFRWA